jgi:hypothetical protein
MPSFHWWTTSIHEKTWNSKSCPDGFPRKKNGTTTAKAATMMLTAGTGKRLGRVLVRAGGSSDGLDWRPWFRCIASPAEFLLTRKCNSCLLDHGSCAGIDRVHALSKQRSRLTRLYSHPALGAQEFLCTFRSARQH